MAEAAIPIEAFKEHVTCTACMDVYEDPRQLPCGHAICFKCYREMFTDSAKCQNCRSECKTKPEDLPKSIPVSNYLDMYKAFANQDTVTVKAKKALVTGKCEIPKCQYNATEKSFANDLKLCQNHFKQNVEELRLSVEETEETLDADNETSESEAVIEKLQKVICGARIIKEALNISAELLHKGIDSLREKLDRILESRITISMQTLVALDEEFNMKRQRRNQMKSAFDKGDYKKCVKAALQIAELRKNKSDMEMVKTVLEYDYSKEFEKIFDEEGNNLCNLLESEIRNFYFVIATAKNVDTTDFNKRMMEYQPKECKEEKDFNGKRLFCYAIFDKEEQMEKVMECNEMIENFKLLMFTPHELKSLVGEIMKESDTKDGKDS